MPEAKHYSDTRAFERQDAAPRLESRAESRLIDGYVVDLGSGSAGGSWQLLHSPGPGEILVYSSRWTDPTLGNGQRSLETVLANNILGDNTQVPHGTLAPAYEGLYDCLGRRRGAMADPDSRQALMSLWADTGEQGALWLCERLRDEPFVERQIDAGEALIAIGRPAIRPMLATLQGSPSETQAEALLETLQWLDVTAPDKPALGMIIRRSLEHRASSVRIAAVAASRRLEPEKAIDVLLYARKREFDPEVIEAIDEQLAGD